MTSQPVTKSTDSASALHLSAPSMYSQKNYIGLHIHLSDPHHRGRMHSSRPRSPSLAVSRGHRMNNFYKHLITPSYSSNRSNTDRSPSVTGLLFSDTTRESGCWGAVLSRKCKKDQKYELSLPELSCDRSRSHFFPNSMTHLTCGRQTSVPHCFAQQTHTHTSDSCGIPTSVTPPTKTDPFHVDSGCAFFECFIFRPMTPLQSRECFFFETWSQLGLSLGGSLQLQQEVARREARGSVCAETKANGKRRGPGDQSPAAPDPK